MQGMVQCCSLYVKLAMRLGQAKTRGTILLHIIMTCLMLRLLRKELRIYSCCNVGVLILVSHNTDNFRKAPNHCDLHLLFLVVPVKDVKQLQLAWALPSQLDDYRLEFPFCQDVLLLPFQE